MSSRKKKNKNKRKRKVSRNQQSPQTRNQTQKQQAITVRLSDLSGRGFPPHNIRQKLVESIRAMPKGDRTSKDWYTLASYLIYDACLEEDDTLMNEGNEALIMAATVDSPVPDALVDLVWFLNLRNIPVMALPYAKQATELLPERRDAWVFRANTHRSLNQKEEAIECLKKAITLPETIPEDKEALEELESNEEISSIGKPIMFFGYPPKNQPLQYTKENQTEAIKLQLFYARQIAEQEPDNPEILYMVAMGYYQLQKFEQAERYLAQLLLIENDHADGFTMAALIRQKQGDLEQASYLYQQAILAQPDHILANTNFAKILMEQDGKYPQAQHHLEIALAGDPDYPPALSLYGNTIGHLTSDFKRESEYHAKALKNMPDSLVIRFCYIMSLWQAGEFWQLKKQWQQYGKSLLKFVKSHPEYSYSVPILEIIPQILEPPSDFSFCMFITEKLMGLLGGQAFVPLLKKAWKLRYSLPNEKEIRSSAYNHLGILAGHCKQHELALEVFREQEKLDGPGKEATLNIAVTLAGMGDFEKALEAVYSVDPKTDRRLTIEANILRDAGRLEEALEKYVEASQIDTDFFMPVTNGIDLGLTLGNMVAIENLSIAAKKNFGGNSEGLYAYAKARLVLGFPTEAADILKGLLYQDDQPHGLSSLNEDSEEATEQDLTVLGELDEKSMFYTLALAFLKSRQYEELEELYSWMDEKQAIHGDWNILRAEMYRYRGKYDKSIEIVDAMSIQPPQYATKALISVATGDWDVINEAVETIFSEDFSHRMFTHPEGNPAAVGFAVKSLSLLNQNNPNDAIEEAQKAIEADPRCALGYVSLAKAYDDIGEPLKAIETAQQGLEHIPGDPGLLEWTILRLLENNQPKDADKILAKYRSHLESCGVAQVGFWLGEQIARAQLKTPTTQSTVINEPWVLQLERESREWLNAAVTGTEIVSSLRLGIAIYYCKIVERELISKIIQPFRDSQPAINSQFDKELQDIQRFLESGRMPGLGSIAYALTVAARPGKYDESQLRRSWRKYLKDLPEPQKSAVRSRSFLEDLKMLANIRNRVAHLGDLNQEEFQYVENAVLNNKKPGSILRLLGID